MESREVESDVKGEITDDSGGQRRRRFFPFGRLERFRLSAILLAAWKGRLRRALQLDVEHKICIASRT